MLLTSIFERIQVYLIAFPAIHPEGVFFLFMSRRIVQFHPPIELVNIDTRFDTNGRRDPLLSMDIGLLVKCPSETSSNLHCGPLHRSQLLFTCHCGWQVKQIHPSLLKITKLRSSSSLSPN